MPNINVLDETAGGWQKVEYQNLGTTGYRTPEDEAGGAYEERTGKSARHAYSASKGQETTTPVRDKETGEIVTREDDSDILEVTGQADAGTRGASETNPTFEIEVGTVETARNVLEEHPEQWEAFQLYGLWRFRCKEGKDSVVVDGWSRVHNANRQVEFKEPVVGVDDQGNAEVAGFETVTADTIAMAYQEASDNAWSQVDCSVAEWTNISLQLKIYAAPQSQMLQQARTQSHVTV